MSATLNGWCLFPGVQPKFVKRRKNDIDVTSTTEQAKFRRPNNALWTIMAVKTELSSGLANSPTNVASGSFTTWNYKTEFDVSIENPLSER